MRSRPPVRAGSALLAAALTGSLLTGCESGYSASHLPTWVSTTVRFEDGSFGSALVSMDNPRVAPEIRYLTGARFFDGERLLQVESTPRWLGAEAPNQVVFDLGVTDHLAGSTTVLPLGVSGHQPELLAAEDGLLAVRVDGERLWYDTFTGEPVQRGAPDKVWRRVGPGKGFSLKQQGGTLWLNLPFRESGLPLFEGVASVLSIDWLTLDQADPDAIAQAYARYKSVRAVHARGTSAVLDGDLREWQHQKALAVDSDASVLDGIDRWQGARDSSFGVAARVNDARLYLAIRIRDDDLRAGRDRLEIEVESRSWTIPVQSAGPIEELAHGAEGLFAEEVSFGTGLELSLPMPEDRPPRTHLPLVVRYLDVDGEVEAEATVLATAPSMHALAIRSWDQAPGEEPPRL